MERTVDNLFPFSWMNSEFIGIISITYEDVLFLEDFGQFKKGEIVPFMIADIEAGILSQVDEEGNVLADEGFKCVPIEN